MGGEEGRGRGTRGREEKKDEGGGREDGRGRSEDQGAGASRLDDLLTYQLADCNCNRLAHTISVKKFEIARHLCTPLSALRDNTYKPCQQKNLGADD